MSESRFGSLKSESFLRANEGSSKVIDRPKKVNGICDVASLTVTVIMAETNPLAPRNLEGVRGPLEMTLAWLWPPFHNFKLDALVETINVFKKNNVPEPTTLRRSLRKSYGIQGNIKIKRVLYAAAGGHKTDQAGTRGVSTTRIVTVSTKCGIC